MSRRTEKHIVKADIMERPIRKAVLLATNLIASGQQYSGSIINISEEGVGMFVLKTSFPDSTINCTKGSLLKLEVQSTLGVYVMLQCRIKWLRIKKCPMGITTSMGMQVIDPPPSFVKLFKSLL